MNGRRDQRPEGTSPRTSGAGAAGTEAAAWVVRLQAPDAGEAEWLAFEAWLQATPDGRAAYDAAMSLWLLADAVDGAIDDDQARRGGRASTGRRRWGKAALGLGTFGVAMLFALAAIIILSPAQKPGPAAPGEMVYATAKGEQRAVRLSDGTEIDLSSASRVSVSLAPNARRVTLTAGEAAFLVTHDPRRPFTVFVGDREVRDLGTEFDIRLAGSQIRVSVRQGLVEVAGRDGPKDPPIALNAGRQLLHDEGSDISTVRSVAIADVFAWKQGRLIYRDQPLRVVVNDLNRYFPHTVRIEGDRAAGLRFTGVLAVDGEDATIRRLEELLPISATRVNGATVLKARDEPR